jgi:hypothetical protein
MKIFFLMVSAGLAASTASGLYMSYKYSRNKLIPTVLFLLGIFFFDCPRANVGAKASFNGYHSVFIRPGKDAMRTSTMYHE